MKAFLVGVGIGVSFGILLAPDTGERTRTKIRGKLNMWNERFRQQVDDLKKTVHSQTDQLSRELGEGRQEQNDQNAATQKDESISFADRDLINSLSRDELMTVNGIGPVLADRIIAGRPYSSSSDLVDRRIIAQSTLDEFKRQFGIGLKQSA
jgi:DNA uptake protein ComE-like DNA-binding protein